MLRGVRGREMGSLIVVVEFVGGGGGLRRRGWAEVMELVVSNVEAEPRDEGVFGGESL